MAQKIPTLLILGLLILVVIVVGYFCISSKWTSMKDLSVQVKEKEQAVLTKQKELDDLKKIEENYTKAKRQVADIPNILPKEDQIPELLIQLDALTKENNMAISSINLTKGAEVEGALYKSLNISLSLIGSYTNLKKYLDSVEKNLRLLDVTSVDFSATPVVPHGPADIFSYTVNIRTYYIE